MEGVGSLPDRLRIDQALSELVEDERFQDAKVIRLRVLAGAVLVCSRASDFLEPSRSRPWKILREAIVC